MQFVRWEEDDLKEIMLTALNQARINKCKLPLDKSYYKMMK
jgi:hypothetical protein